MPGDLTPYSLSGALSRDARRASRSISRSEARRAVRSAEIAQEAQIVVEKQDAMSFAVGSAMAKVTQVAQAQAQLELLAPQASARLNYIAETHALTLGAMVSDLAHDLRRK